MGSRNFEQFRVSGEKIEEHGRQPTKVHMFLKMARQQARLYDAAYGKEHLNERLDAVDRLSDIHGECPEFPTSQFLIETWASMVYQYDDCIAGGIHFIIRKYDGWIIF